MSIYRSQLELTSLVVAFEEGHALQQSLARASVQLTSLEAGSVLRGSDR